MSLLGDVMVRLGLNVKDFQNGLKEAEKSMGKVGRNLQDVGKKMATRISAPLIGVGTIAVKVGADYEQSMSKLKAITGSSADEIASLSEEARRLGRDTKYTANEVADGMTYLGLAGFKTNDILATTEDVLNLASISGLDLATTADIASNMLSGMGMDSSELGKIVDSMAYTMSNANTDVMGLGDAFVYAAPIIADFDGDVSELTAAIGLLGDAGMQGGMAGRMIANGLTRLASPTDSASKLMTQLGIDAFDAEDNLKSMPEVIAQLEKGFEQLSPKERAGAMKELFGMENAKGWSTLISMGSEELAIFADEIDNATGAGKDMADEMNDNLYGKLNSLKAILSDVGIEFYESIEEPLKKVVESIEKAVKSFSELEDEVKIAVVVVTAIATVLPFLIIGLGIVVTAIEQAIKVFRIIGTVLRFVWNVFRIVRTALLGLSGPIGWVILGIIALVTAGIALYKNWDKVSKYISDIWDKISTVFSDSMEAIGEWISDFVSNAKEWFSDTWDNILTGITDFLDSAGDWFRDGWESISESTVDIFTGIIDWLMDWGSKIYEATGLKTVVDSLIATWEFFSDVFIITSEMLIDMADAVFSLLYDAVAPYVKAVVRFFTESWEYLKTITKVAFTAVSTLATNLWKRITKIWESIKKVTFTVFTSIKDKLTSIWDAIYNAISAVVTALWNKVKSIWDIFKRITVSIFNSIKKQMKSIWDSISKVVGKVVGSIWSNVKEKFNSIKEAMSKPVEEAKDKIKKALDAIKRFFSQLKLKFPMPSMPSFGVERGSATFLGKKITVPKFKVNWNAKGNIFNGASILGGGQGVGEAGAEVVMPIQHKRYMKPYATMVAELMDDMKKDGGDSGSIQNIFEIAELIVREDADVEKIAKKLEEIQRKNDRAKGKLVY